MTQLAAVAVSEQFLEQIRAHQARRDRAALDLGVLLSHFEAEKTRLLAEIQQSLQEEGVVGEAALASVGVKSNGGDYGIDYKTGVVILNGQPLSLRSALL